MDCLQRRFPNVAITGLGIGFLGTLKFYGWIIRANGTLVEASFVTDLESNGQIFGF
jgi:hypothetical protein